MSTGSYSQCALVLFIACVKGQFGLNDCDHKCHCKDVKEDCQVTEGKCKNGCAQNYAGDTCQGNAVLTA